MEHKAQKVVIDGYTFDSKKEGQFYWQFVKNYGLKFEVHPHFRYVDKKAKDGLNIGSKIYTPDFVIYEGGEIKHIYDVKTSVSLYGMTQGARDNIYWFQRMTPYWVQLVVPRSHDFQMTLYGTTSKTVLDAHAHRDRHGNVKYTSNGNCKYDYYNVYPDFNYDLRDIVGC